MRVRFADCGRIWCVRKRFKTFSSGSCLGSGEAVRTALVVQMRIAFQYPRISRVKVLAVLYSFLNSNSLCYLVCIDDIADNLTAVSGGGAAERLQDPVRIIHKDQDMINAFCINSVNSSLLNTISRFTLHASMYLTY